MLGSLLFLISLLLDELSLPTLIFLNVLKIIIHSTIMTEVYTQGDEGYL